MGSEARKRRYAAPRGRMSNGGAYKAWLVVLVLGCTTALVYSPVRTYEFVNYDDDAYVTSNEQVQRGLRLEGLSWALMATAENNWHPLTWMSHMLDVHLFGLNPGGHHVTNLLLHVANVLLLFAVLRQATGALWRSAFVAGVFALHPLNVESVAWIAERKNVLSTLFWLLTLGAYVAYVRAPTRKRYLVVVALFVLGLAAKPMLVTLPCVLLLFDWWPLERWRVGEGSADLRRIWALLVVEKIPLFALAAASSVLTLRAQGHTVATAAALSLEQRVANALAVYVGYIGKMFWPTDLAVFYPYERLSLTSWQAAFAGLALLLISAGAYWSAKRSPAVGVGWLWYVGTLVPVVGLVQVGSQAMADRYTYVPLIGLFLLITWGLTDMAVRIGLSTRALAAGGVCVLALLTASSSAQLSYWRNSIALFQRTLEVTHGNYIAHTNLGTALMAQGGTDKAIAHYREALAINAGYEETHNALALALTTKGDLDGAIEQLQEVVEINPDSPFARNKLGIMLSQKGQLAEAIRHFEQGIASNPRDAPLRENLGITLEQLGDLEGARATYERALRLVADDESRARIHNRIGNVFLREGNIATAVEHYREALRLAPGYEKARLNLDLALRQLKS